MNNDCAGQQLSKRKTYTINIEAGCPVLCSNRLMVRAMDALPLDTQIIEMKYEGPYSGWIKFTSSNLSYTEFPPLQFVVEESVKLKQQESK